MSELTIYTGTLPDPTGGFLTADFVTLREYKCLQAAVNAALGKCQEIKANVLAKEYLDMHDQGRLDAAREILRALDGEVKP